MVKAVNAELAVKAMFEMLGFQVSQTSGKGPDLVCSADGISINVEVKTTNGCGVDGKVYWRTGPVTEKRVNDDLVAIVTNDGRIFLDDMKEHLRRCAKSRQRSVTKLIGGTR